MKPTFLLVDKVKIKGKKNLEWKPCAEYNHFKRIILNPVVRKQLLREGVCSL